MQGYISQIELHFFNYLENFTFFRALPHVKICSKSLINTQKQYQSLQSDINGVAIKCVLLT